MFFIHPMLKMRMKKIVYLLENANAFSEESAKGINEIGLMNPNFPRDNFDLWSKLAKKVLLCRAFFVISLRTTMIALAGKL